MLEAERAILFGSAEKERDHCSLFEGKVKSLLEAPILKFRRARDSIDLVDVLKSSLPVRLIQCPRSEHYMILRLLCCKHERLLVIVVLDQLAVLAGHNSARHLVLVLAEHWDLEEH